MTKTTMGRRAAAVLIAATSAGVLLATPTAGAAGSDAGTETGAVVNASAPLRDAPVPLRDAIAALRVADENRAGYDRDAFRHWIDADKNGCNTRAEVLISEAVVAPTIGPRCALTGGRWYSYYDNVFVDSAGALDVDHMVPLAEAWDSGASAWTPQQRQDYANDLTQPRALVAVTAKTNRQKADQDPSTWMPPYEGARCTYLTDWVTVKTKYDLTVDQTEKSTLEHLAATCPNNPVDPGPR
jgi:uncharacterized protein DUF1524